MVSSMNLVSSLKSLPQVSSNKKIVERAGASYDARARVDARASRRRDAQIIKNAFVVITLVLQYIVLFKHFQESTFFPLGLREWTGFEAPWNWWSPNWAFAPRLEHSRRGAKPHLWLLCWFNNIWGNLQISGIHMFPLDIREWTGFAPPRNW